MRCNVCDTQMSTITIQARAGDEEATFGEHENPDVIGENPPLSCMNRFNTCGIIIHRLLIGHEYEVDAKLSREECG